MLQRFATLKDDFEQAGTTNSFVRQVCISVEQGLKRALSVATFLLHSLHFKELM